jgi:hypothetical protein
VDINTAWETSTENIKISAKEGHGSMKNVQKKTSQTAVVTGSKKNKWG